MLFLLEDRRLFNKLDLDFPPGTGWDDDDDDWEEEEEEEFDDEDD